MFVLLDGSFLFGHSCLFSHSWEYPVTPSPFGLTPRELDVLQLLAQGLSDAQITEQLVIARRTVNWHPTSISHKLAVSSRAAAAHAALEQHLL